MRFTFTKVLKFFLALKNSQSNQCIFVTSKQDINLAELFKLRWNRGKRGKTNVRHPFYIIDSVYCHEGWIPSFVRKTDQMNEYHFLLFHKSQNPTNYYFLSWISQIFSLFLSPSSYLAWTQKMALGIL